MQDDVTPEEKLLKLIKEEPSASPKVERKETQAPEKALPSQTSLAFLNQKGYRFGLMKRVTGFSVGTAILFLIVLTYQILSQSPILPLPIRAGVALEQLALPKITLNVKENFDTTYGKIFEKRSVFKSIGEPPPAATQGRTAGFSDTVKNFNLTGIIDGEKPQAIIEDRSNGQIYYVSNGDYVGVVQVVEVAKGHVVLRYAEEEGQLTL